MNVFAERANVNTRRERIIALDMKKNARKYITDTTDDNRSTMTTLNERAEEYAENRAETLGRNAGKFSQIYTVGDVGDFMEEAYLAGARENRWRKRYPSWPDIVYTSNTYTLQSKTYSSSIADVNAQPVGGK